MRKKIKRIVLQLIGWIFVIAGVAGLFLPVLQGILFLLVGLAILSSEYIWARRLLEKVRGRYPGMAERMDEASHRASRWLRRMLNRSAPTNPGGE